MQKLKCSWVALFVADLQTHLLLRCQRIKTLPTLPIVYTLSVMHVYRR